MTFDAAGTITGGEEFASADPGTAVAISGSATVGTHGEIDPNGPWASAVDELVTQLDAGKTVAIGARTEADPFDSFTVGQELWIKHGTSYVQADLAGASRLYLFSDRRDAQQPRVQRLFSNVDASGNVAGGAVTSDRVGSDLAGTAMLGEHGAVDVSGLAPISSQHLTLDAGRTVLGGVVTLVDANGSHPTLVIGVKSLPGTPRLLLPAAGSKLAHDTATFRWSDEGTAADAYALWLGSAPGRNDLFPPGTVSQVLGADARTLELALDHLPADGRPVHARLWYRVDGVWRFGDVAYEAPGARPRLIEPLDVMVLPEDKVTFRWSADGIVADQWALWFGRSPGARNLPLQRSDMPGAPPAGFVLTAGSTFTGTTQTFTWDPCGVRLEAWALRFGATPGGSEYGFRIVTDPNAAQISYDQLPYAGETVYVTLWWRVNGVWARDDALPAWDLEDTAVEPVLTAHAAASVFLGAAPVVFQWDARGVVAEQWAVTYGSAPQQLDYGYGIVDGSADQIGSDAFARDVAPMGKTVHVTLWARRGGVWRATSTDYEFVSAFPSLIEPSPVGGVLPADAEEVVWFPRSIPAGQWAVRLGATPGGYEYGYGFAPAGADRLAYSAFTVFRPPATPGQTVYLSLWARRNGVWSSSSPVTLVTAGDDL